jgi:chorismate mutase
MDISALRDKINIIDLEILQKLRERMVVSKEIGLYKKKNNILILDNKREELLLKFLANCEIKIFNDEKNEEFITELWNVIMKYSKKNQLI